MEANEHSDCPSMEIEMLACILHASGWGEGMTTLESISESIPGIAGAH